MGAVLGLGLGVGLFLIWWSFWEPEPPPAGAGSVGQPGGALGVRVRELLVQAGVHEVGPAALVAACAGLGVVVGLGVLAVSAAPPIAVCFGLIAAWLPIIGVRSRARRRRTVLRELWPEVVDNLSSGVRAGLSLPEALAQLGERGPAELRGAFAAFARDYRTSGRFGEALRITREVGGSDLGRLLRTLSAFLREDARVRAELEARQSWTVNAARLAVGAPWAVLGILATRPESVRPYNSTAGVVVLAFGAGVSVLAYRLMRRLARLPEERRVLR